MKYKLIEKDSIRINDRILYRIQAIRDIPEFNVKQGDIGGYIESEWNLSQDDDTSWVFENARVFGNAQVYGNARVFGNAWVFGNARVFGNAQVFGNARVYGNARVFGNARVCGNAWVYKDAQVYEDAQVYGDAPIEGVIMVIPVEPPVIDIAPIAEQITTPVVTEFEGFQEGDKVYYTNKKGNRLLIDYPYTVVKVYPKNLIRVNGIPSLWSIRHFKVYEREAVPVPMQKPIVQELSLNEQLAKKQLYGLCNFAIKYRKGGVKFYLGSPCHAAMAQPYSDLTEDIILAVACNVSRDYQQSPHKKEYVEFITYIIQESPWASCFIPKPIEDVLKDGIELNVMKEANMVVASAIALRLAHEYSFKLPIFSKSLRLGFSKTVAFLSFQFGIIEKESIHVNCHGGSHNVISSTHKTLDLIHFFTNGYAPQNVPSYSVKHDFYRIHNAISQIDRGKKDLSTNIKESKFVNKSRNSDAWGSVLFLYNGNNITECVANMGNCFVSLGFK